VVPEYPDFKPLEFKDHDLILENLNSSERNICELCPGNFYIWKDFDHTRLTLINQNLCVLISPANEPPYFLEPLGRHKIKETIDICLKHSRRISRASEDFLSKFPREYYQIFPLRDQFDYIFGRETLAELKGKKFDGKRNHIKKFQRRFPQYGFIPLDESLKTKALVLFEKWFSIRKQTKYFIKLDYEAQKEALLLAFSNYDKLNLLGSAILIDRSVKGFILGSTLNRETIAVHFLYSDTDLPGISQTLLWEACNKTFNNYNYINLEQDLGITGLRAAKLSYHPLRLEEKFEINPLTQP
jgi:hypothetical protein